MTQPYVLSFIGENANGILRWWTEEILRAFEQFGLSSRLINLRQADWQSRMNESLALGRPAFCFSFQGMGMDLRLPNGDSFWASNAVPFVSYLGDNPYHAPALHAVEGPGFYMLYGCADFLETYETYLYGRAYATTVQLGYPLNPYADRTPWEKRSHKMVFVKTGVDPEALCRAWLTYPARIREILHESAALVLTGADRTVASVCAQCFQERRMEWGGRREFFLSTCSLVDRYIRAVKADAMVRALMKHDALIVGDWSYLHQAGMRARFIGPIPADELNDLYADTKIIISTAAGSRFGVHERVAAGLLAKAAVISDTSPFVQNLLHECPSFYGISEIGDSMSCGLDETVQNCLSGAGISQDVETSFSKARSLFSLDQFAKTILDHVALEGYRRTVSPWASPASARQYASK